MADKSKTTINRKRLSLLKELDILTDKVLVFLGIFWLMLVVIELSFGLSPLLKNLTVGIWLVFIFDFFLQFFIAPKKIEYLKTHWIIIISLLVPFLRVFRLFRSFRILRITRTLRSLNLLRIITSLNRGINSINKVLSQRGIGYISALTILVMFVGAVGINYFENPNLVQNRDNQLLINNVNNIANFGDALWWSAMIMTTIGSDYWPKTFEGRILTWFLSLYGFAIFGYLTALIASSFIKSDQKNKRKIK